MLKILIVDDNPLIRMGIKNMIKWEELHAELAGAAEDGEDALEKIREYSPNLVITDIRMPGKDGVYLLEQIREQFENLYTIVVSAYNEFDYVKEALKSGSIDYILKPINPLDLNAAIKKAAERNNCRNFINGSFTGKKPFFIAVLKTIDKITEEDFQKYFPDSKNMEIVSIRDNTFQFLIYEKNVNKFIEDINNNFSGVYLWGWTEVQAEDTITSAWKKACCDAADHLPFKPDHSDFFNDSLDIENEFRLLCSTGDASKLKNLSHKYFYSIREKDNFTFSVLHNTIHRCFFFMDLKNEEEMQLINKMNEKLSRMESELTYYCLEEILNDMDKIIEAVCEQRLREKNNTIDLVQQVKNLIDKNYASELSLSTIASLFYVSPSYLSRCFKSKTNMNIVKYITELRLEKADYLLKNTDKRVVDIAKQVGFEDPNYFTRVYKKKYGVSPKTKR